MKNEIKQKIKNIIHWVLKNSLSVFSCLVMVALLTISSAYSSSGTTTIGESVSTTNLTTTGTATIGSTLTVAGTSTLANINLNTNGTNALFSTYQGANSDGENIFIGGGGQNSVGDVAYTPYGSYNTAIGIEAFLLNTLGNYNTANGYQSLYSNTSGFNNTANGTFSLYSNTIGVSNTANGYFSLGYNTTGNLNTANGTYSLLFNTGSNNVAMGYAAGYGVENSSNISNSVLLGYEAGKVLLTAGSNNILIGYKAGDALTTGAKNIVIGYDIDAPAVSSANTLNIGNFIYGTGLDGSGTTLSAGKVGIGTSTPAVQLHIVNGTSDTFEAIGSGNITTNRGHLCLWNGASYTITEFASNSITPIYSTSTACQ